MSSSPSEPQVEVLCSPSIPYTILEVRREQGVGSTAVAPFLLQTGEGEGTPLQPDSSEAVRGIEERMGIDMREEKQADPCWVMLNGSR